MQLCYRNYMFNYLHLLNPVVTYILYSSVFSQLVNMVVLKQIFKII